MKFSQLSVVPAALVFALNTGVVIATESQEKELDNVAETYNASVEDEQEVVCELVATIGSRIKQKSCRTKQQIKQDQDEGRKFLSRHKGVTTNEQ